MKYKCLNCGHEQDDARFKCDWCADKFSLTEKESEKHFHFSDEFKTQYKNILNFTDEIHNIIRTKIELIMNTEMIKKIIDDVQEEITHEEISLFAQHYELGFLKILITKNMINYYWVGYRDYETEDIYSCRC